MKVIDVMKMHKTEREAKCPKGGFSSIRALVESDGMGFTVTRTTVHPTDDWQLWHYKHHLEACYCIAGHGQLKNADTGEIHEIKPGVLYALDKHDRHYFKTAERCVLICVFNPPLVGHELHGEDGCYPMTVKECATPGNETPQERMAKAYGKDNTIGRMKLAAAASVPPATAQRFLKRVRPGNV